MLDIAQRIPAFAGARYSELAKVPRRIAVASGDKKVSPIVAVLRGGAAGELVTDDRTAGAVVERMEENADAA